jgi:hypothetical protein
MNPSPEGATCYFGVPRYLIRGFLEEFAKWTIGLNPKRRFFHRLQLFLIAGQIAESRARVTTPRRRVIGA